MPSDRHLDNPSRDRKLWSRASKSASCTRISAFTEDLEMYQPNCICPSCGAAHCMTGDSVAISETWLGYYVMICPGCLAIPSDIRDKVNRIKVKHLERREFTNSENRLLEKWPEYDPRKKGG